MSSAQPGPSNFEDKHSGGECMDFALKNGCNKKFRWATEDSDQSDTEYKDNLNVNWIAVDNELSDSTFDEVDNEGDVNIESMELHKPVEDTKNTEEWGSDSNFKKFSFEAKASFLNAVKGADPCHFFDLLFDTNFFSMIVTQTNKYIEHVAGDTSEKITSAEFKTFLGLLLHMGTVKCPKIQNYWSAHRLYSFDCFSQHMSRQRFQCILRTLNFSYNCLNKVYPVINYFNNKMKDIYYPHREFLVHEAMIPWECKFALQEYVVENKHTNEMKLYKITDSSGVTFRIKACTGTSTESSKQDHRTHMILHILEDFLQKGHSAYMANFSTSFMLSKKLLDAKTYCTGLLKRLKTECNADVINAKLLKGEVISRYKNNIMIGKFRDRKDIFFISSEFNTDLIEFENRKKEKSREPLALYKYNKFVNHISENDRMLSHYTCSKNTFKWYIKLWINLIETLLLNAFFLYSNFSSSVHKLNFYNFRLSVIDIMLFHKAEIIPHISHKFQHLPEILPRDYSNKIKRKRCRQCFANGLRKETKYFCSGCKDNPGLCLGKCFRTYHTCST